MRKLVGGGRKSTIEHHPERNAIARWLVLGEHKLPGGMPKSQIAKRVGVTPDAVLRWRKKFLTEEMERAILANERVSKIEADTAILNEDRLDVSRTYETLAKRVERLIEKAEQNEDDGFALAAMEGLRKVLRDIAQMQGKLATALTVEVKLSESPEWVVLREILQEVCREVPAAREPLIRHMRRQRLSITQEDRGVL